MKLSDLNEGQTIQLDNGFMCAHAGPVIVKTGEHGFYFDCKDGHHLLDGQVDDNGDLVGISEATHVI